MNEIWLYGVSEQGEDTRYRPVEKVGQPSRYADAFLPHNLQQPMNESWLYRVSKQGEDTRYRPAEKVEIAKASAEIT